MIWAPNKTGTGNECKKYPRLSPFILTKAEIGYNILKIHKQDL